MKRRTFMAMLTGIVVTPFGAEAPQAAKVARIGYLSPNLAAFPHIKRPSVKDCATSATSRAAPS